MGVGKPLFFFISRVWKAFSTPGVLPWRWVHSTGQSLDRRWTLSETSYSVAGPSLGAELRTRLRRSRAQLFAVCALGKAE